MVIGLSFNLFLKLFTLMLANFVVVIIVKTLFLKAMEVIPSTKPFFINNGEFAFIEGNVSLNTDDELLNVAPQFSLPLNVNSPTFLVSTPLTTS